MSQGYQPEGDVKPTNPPTGGSSVQSDIHIRRVQRLESRTEAREASQRAGRRRFRLFGWSFKLFGRTSRGGT